MTKMLVWFALFLVPPTALAGGPLGPRLAARIAQSDPADTVGVIVRLADRTPEVPADPGRRALARQIRKAARALSGTTPELAGVVGRQAVASGRTLWVINAVALRVPVQRVESLAAVPGVSSVFLDETIRLRRLLPAVTCSSFARGWNVDHVGAPAAWDEGNRGQGVVVGVIDSGVDAGHPDLSAGWRGGTNSWFDAFGQFSTPTDDDADAHGTGVVGVVVGGDTGGFSMGVAPDAQWIAARAFQDTPSGLSSTVSQLLSALQWMADPDGDPATDDAPRVVNGSWSINRPGEFTESPGGVAVREAVVFLRAGGALPVFAGGNSGNGIEDTSESPANYPEAFAVGAHGPTEGVLFDSGRGPSAHDGSSLYPDLVAPGDCVTTADQDQGVGDLYAIRTGTSFAAPHVAGAAALLWSADPTLSVDQVELELKSAVRFVPDQTVPDTTAGYGQLDLTLSPVLQALPSGALSGVTLVSDAGGDVAAGTSVTLTATPSDEGTFEYRFWLAGPGGDGAARVGRDFATNPVWLWIPGGGDTGTTRVVVQARRPGSPLVYEVGASTEVVVVDPTQTTAVTAAPSSGVALGRTVTFTASSTGGSGRYEFRFLLEGPGTGGLEVVGREFSPEATWAWLPGVSDEGETRVVVESRNLGSKGKAPEATAELTVSVVDLDDALDAAARDAGLDLPDRGSCFVGLLGPAPLSGPRGGWITMALWMIFGGGIAFVVSGRWPRGLLLVLVVLPLTPGRVVAAEGRWDVQLSLGAFRPSEDTWRDHYDRRTQFDVRAGVGFRLLGDLETGIEIGYRKGSGEKTVSVDTGTGVVTDSIDLDLVVVPVHAFVLYPLRFRASQFLVPYVAAGIGPTFYRQRVERGDDTTGYLWGVQGRIGCRVSLDRLDPSGSQASRESLGLTHSYLFLEGTYSVADDLGGHGTDLGGYGVYSGVSVEF